ncbi:hypothetical protein BFW38_14880 [Terasakiispira papahanaumokuakeensis]|uniref:Uncharacterized protein n=1 Tax=Terasakiispira papahanaumokuakeensis TaxID=197479 RepID=A0A1E2VCA0_9GAMM|nr:hypothetical protein [Terasakiispira papahanaumokuakeensis]ODC04619.1 hypothetical protein BFW38_14880 [Terasakiispira papahanaumokuakeensis]
MLTTLRSPPKIRRYLTPDQALLLYPTEDSRPIIQNQFPAICQSLGQRLAHLWQDEPIPFRPQNQGDYDIPSLTLKEHIAPDQHGFSAHLR